ncbi:MAG: LytTR family transcriptional regulator [Firmicutes bacterium]|nr:LytTR family transcriptional regulator [Bacillota bacterium]
MGSMIKVLRSGTFFISFRNRSRLIDAKKIIFIQKDRRKIIFHMVRKEKGKVVPEKVCVYGVFREITAGLGDNFLWCHKSYILNMDGVYGFEDNDVVLKTGERIKLGRDVFRATRNICFEYMANKRLKTLAYSHHL